MTNLTPTINGVDRQIEQMVSKAMCAYANWRETSNANFNDPRFRHVSQYEAEAEHRSEYEATVRCIALFVEEHVPSICEHVIARAEDEFGI